jgi:hypothetical protein
MEAGEDEYVREVRSRCAHCGDVIGVYEPLVHVTDELARRTSRAAEPDICGSDGLCYHAGCYDGHETISW